MNQKQTKRLRKALLTKTAEVLTLIRNEYGSQTEKTETPQAVWRQFKELYKNGRVPAKLLK